jgi:hypothetical protein
VDLQNLNLQAEQAIRVQPAKETVPPPKKDGGMIGFLKKTLTNNKSKQK